MFKTVGFYHICGSHFVELSGWSLLCCDHHELKWEIFKHFLISDFQPSNRACPGNEVWFCILLRNNRRRSFEGRFRFGIADFRRRFALIRHIGESANYISNRSYWTGFLKNNYYFRNCIIVLGCERRFCFKKFLSRSSLTWVLITYQPRNFWLDLLSQFLAKFRPNVSKNPGLMNCECCRHRNDQISPIFIHIWEFSRHN